MAGYSGADVNKIVTDAARILHMSVRALAYVRRQFCMYVCMKQKNKCVETIQ